MARFAAAADAWSPRVLSIVRIMTALLLLQHGTQKFFNFPPRDEPRPYELMTLSPGLAGILEVFGGLLLLLGLFTRPVAFVLSGFCAFAYWMAHAPRSFYPILNGGDAAVLFCFILLYMAFSGGGPWSLDAAMRRPRGGGASLDDPASERTDWAE